MRQAGSHKGENGTVAIIGGSRHQHGAPIFSALAAEASGVDLVYLFVPVLHEEVAKTASLNFQVRTFGSTKSDELSATDRTHIVEFLATIDAAVIGPGLSRTPSGIRSILELLEAIPCATVADASALQEGVLKVLFGRHGVVTPHLGELERMGLTREQLPAISTKHACTILLKSQTDTVVAEDGSMRAVDGGNAGLTVGGTGDALAGLIAGLIAQGMDHADAAVLASQTIKGAGDALFTEVGYSYTTRDVIAKIPALLKGKI
jgi:ADP-dependent NAD(P)H-hydrate dehydratase / NAD(P)H-hydrate epimerase